MLEAASAYREDGNSQTAAAISRTVFGTGSRTGTGTGTDASTDRFSFGL